MRWPWQPSKGERELKARFEGFKVRVGYIEDALIKAGVARFVKVVDYTLDMELQYETPEIVDLFSLQARLETLEKQHPAPESSLTKNTTVRVDFTVRSYNQLTQFLTFHETDIALGLEDYGKLRDVFIFAFDVPPSTGVK